MKRSELFLWWADKGAAAHYCASELSASDFRRAAAVRSPKALDDWKVSRALLQAMRTGAAGPTVSLSHSRAHALGATAPAGWQIGVDLERIRSRDVDRLGQWVCTAAERDALDALTGTARLEYFYLLWTLKEAFVKAAGLDFPADMAAVGLDSAFGDQRLRAPAGLWHACSYRLADAWVASVVWREPAAAGAGLIRPDWRAAVECPLPPLAVLGQWQSER